MPRRFISRTATFPNGESPPQRGLSGEPWYPHELWTESASEAPGCEANGVLREGVVASVSQGEVASAERIVGPQRRERVAELVSSVI